MNDKVMLLVLMLIILEDAFAKVQLRNEVSRSIAALNDAIDRLTGNEEDEEF